MLITLFRDKERAEETYDFLRSRGYDDAEISLLLSEATLERWFLRENASLNNLYRWRFKKTAGSLLEEAVEEIADTIPDLRRNTFSISNGVIVVGPVATAIEHNGVGPSRGVFGPLSRSGIPRKRVEQYELGVLEGGLMIGFEPHGLKDANEFVEMSRIDDSHDLLDESPRNLVRSELRDPPDVRKVIFYSPNETSMPIVRKIWSSERPAEPDHDDSDTVCHFYADIEKEVELNSEARINVTVSRELIDLFSEAKETTDIDLEKKIQVKIIPITNFDIPVRYSTEICPPVSGSPVSLEFFAKATNPGPGEIWVLGVQEAMTLVTLKLKTLVVESSADRKRGLSSAKETVPEAPILEEPIDTLKIIEISESKYFFEYEFHSTGDIDYETIQIKGDKTEYINSIYKNIEQMWISNQRDVESFEASLRAYGRQLFEDLIPNKLKNILWKNRNKVKSILVTSTEPFIPWELVHLKDPDEPNLPKETIFLGQLGLVRWIHGAGLPPKNLKLRQGRARYLIPDYPIDDLKLPEATLESEYLTQKFKADPVPPREREVRDLIGVPGGFDLLHFAGHGEADMENILNARLLLQGRLEKVWTGGAGIVPASDSMDKYRYEYRYDYLSASVVAGFANLRARDNRPMIVLNACQTGRMGNHLTSIGGFAPAFLKGGAGVFVGTLWAVGDGPARIFTETLYSKMTDGKARLAEAVIAARKKAAKSGDATWLAYVVYGHPHTRVRS